MELHHHHDVYLPNSLNKYVTILGTQKPESDIKGYLDEPGKNSVRPAKIPANSPLFGQMTLKVTLTYMDGGDYTI